MSRAQQLFDRQLQVDCVQRLQPFAERLNPRHAEIFRNFDAQYYWSAFQCEWASDILFRPGALQRLEPLLLRHGLLNFSSPDILRFLGKRLSVSGSVPDGFTGAITGSLKSRVTGERLKYWTQGNSLKCYGKAHAFSTLDDTTRMAELIRPLQQPREYRNRRVRALRPFADDYTLLEAVNHGEFML